MGQETWRVIRSLKFFYVNSYRRSLSVLVFSLISNVVFILLIYYAYFSQPERDFYATNGMMSPIKLAPLTTPNNQSEALLAPDPESVNDVKVIPN